jgi:hypothetical protein
MYRTRLVCAAYARMNISPYQARRMMYNSGLQDGHHLNGGVHLTPEKFLSSVILSILSKKVQVALLQKIKTLIE